MVNVELPEPLTEVGLRLAVPPVGAPEALKLTLPVKPFCAVTVIVLVPLFPCVTVTLVGDADRVKFGCATAFTVRLKVVVWVKLPDVPVMMIV
jgi:hypothetical protein